MKNIFDNLSRFFNIDDLGFATNPQTRVLLVHKKLVFCKIKSGSKTKNTNITLLATSADGQIFYAMLNYWKKTIPLHVYNIC